MFRHWRRARPYNPRTGRNGKRRGGVFGRARFRHQQTRRPAKETIGCRSFECDGMEGAYYTSRWHGARVSGFSGQHCNTCRLKLGLDLALHHARASRKTDSGLPCCTLGHRYRKESDGGIVYFAQRRSDHASRHYHEAPSRRRVVNHKLKQTHHII